MKKYCKKHQDQLLISLILLALYLGEAALRPFIAPAEYQFIVQLKTLLPEYPDSKLLIRLPSILATFTGAGAVLLLGKLWNFKNPGRAAAFFLLFPPVFYLGTAATLMPLISAGVLLALYGLLKSSQSKSFKERFFSTLLILPAVIATGIYVESSWCTIKDMWMIGITAAALILIQWFNYLDQDNERACKYLDRTSRIMSIALIILALGVLIPALLRHFKVDFPADFALYRRGERIIRPLLMLILPMIWLNLARGARKSEKKLFLIGGAAAFFLFTLPLTLPWHIQKEIYWDYSFEKLAGELPAAGAVCFAENREAPFFKGFFKYQVRTIGTENNEIKPADLRSAIDQELKKHDVLVVCSSDELEKYCPVYNGKRYSIADLHIFHYFKNGVTKK